MKQGYEPLIRFVEKNRNRILNAERTIWKHPEIGYKEWKTTAFLEKEFEDLGYTLTKAGDIPGFIADLDTGKPGPKVAILGELDSLLCATHPEADPETQAVHACGHNCQTSLMLGVAAAMKEPGALEGLCGSVRFIAVPAEETIDLEFRNHLIDQKTIQYVAGKIEFMRRGFLDGVDMAMLVHASTMNDALFSIDDGSNGCITKHFEFEGVAAHAGAAPHLGINALYAANIGMTACNALRETFREQDTVRFHPIITQAGVAANAIPNLAKMDAYVRASTVETMVETNRKINRALAASAAAMGANLLIQDCPGNMPLNNDVTLNAMWKQAAENVFGEGSVKKEGWSTGSSDMGDLSVVMPTMQVHAAGAIGNLHGFDFQIADPEKTCVNPAKILCCMLFDLLSDNAAGAKRVCEHYKPLYNSISEYFEAIDRMKMSKRTVVYQENGTVLLDFENR